ncbi:MAG: serine/threonine protein kinase [Polyangiaceae bacterium]|nr:serine/threonine protein kinase [Polyangiaceae bacterium]
MKFMSEGDAFGLVGSVLKDHLQIQSVVGAGGFGTVYRAYHTKLASPVAVKCLRIPDFLDAAGRNRFVEKFIAEGRLMYELSRADAGIVKSIEVDVLTLPTGVPVPYLVLEWVDGQPLESLIEANMREGKRAPIEEVIERLDPVARALSAAHDGNVAHRDIKPSNIMLTQVLGRQTAKILDFGIAKIVQETGGGAHTTRDQGESSFGFTPCYAAPEQWVARYGATGPWTDVFAFALVCVEYLTAQMALPGDTIPHWMGASMDTSQRPTPRSRGVDLGDAVESVFLKALAVNPNERYRHMQTFWADLKNAASARGSRSSMPDVSGHAATQYAGQQSANVVVRPPSGGDQTFGGDRTHHGPSQTPPPPGTVPGAYLPHPTPPPPHNMFTPPMGPMHPPMGGFGPQAIGASSAGGGMGMMPMGPGGYPTQREPEKSGLSPVILGSILAFLLCVFGLMVAFTIRMLNDREGGPTAVATGTLPSLGAPGRPRSADEMIGSTDPTKPADAPGALSVFCVPACDLVLVDGKPVGASPVVSTPLRPGRHVVNVSRVGAAPQQSDVFIPAGGAVAHRFWLEP